MFTSNINLLKLHIMISKKSNLFSAEVISL